MEKSRNCPNCGAPYDVTLNKCPYCGTSYFDLSAIDIYDTEPFYLKLKSGNMIFTSKVVVKSDVLIKISNDVTDITDGHGNIIKTIVSGKSVDIDIGFKSVVDGKTNTLYTYVVNEE